MITRSATGPYMFYFMCQHSSVSSSSSCCSLARTHLALVALNLCLLCAAPFSPQLLQVLTAVSTMRFGQAVGFYATGASITIVLDLLCFRFGTGLYTSKICTCRPCTLCHDAATASPASVQHDARADILRDSKTS